MSTTANTANASTVLQGLDGVRDDLEGFYRQLHEHPELSHQETATADAVAGRLRAAGFEVHTEVGGTGVVGILANGDGPTVLLRADMDALPVQEQTGLPYASTVTATSADGQPTPVMHACGHDVHVASLAVAAALLAGARNSWHGTLVALFQPAEEVADGASGMIDDGLKGLVGSVDVALAQHVLPLTAGFVGSRVGSVLSAADSMRITLHGRGAHGSMPQAAVDPVVLAAIIVVRLQTIVSRQLAATQPAVLTVGSIHAGTASNVIGDHAVLELNVRTYDQETRTQVLDSIRRIVQAECEASQCPAPPEFELFDRFPPTVNDPQVTDKVAAAFADHFGQRAGTLPLQSASEDFSDIPTALGVPYSYWGVGCIDADTYAAAVKAGRVAQDIPVNHSPTFAPVIQPTLDTATSAMVVAALAYLGS